MSAATLFRIIHFVWAIIGICVCVSLIISRGGHPPAIILLPGALLFWAVGHALLLFSSKLFTRGKKLETRTEVDGKKWPLSLVILAFFLGGVFISGVMVIILLILFGNDWLSQMPVMLALWLPPSACFIGILLHKPWARVLAGWWFIGLATIYLYLVVSGVMRGRTTSMTEWIFVLAVVLIPMFVGQHILRSLKIKAFYGKF